MSDIEQAIRDLIEAELRDGSVVEDAISENGSICYRSRIQS